MFFQNLLGKTLAVLDPDTGDVAFAGEVVGTFLTDEDDVKVVLQGEDSFVVEDVELCLPYTTKLIGKRIRPEVENE